MSTPSLSTTFINRRIHSFFGLWIVIYLIEHLVTNSQAALFIGGTGNEFVKIVNGIHNLPYLPVIEIVLLGIPILIHGLFGIRYIFTGKFNSFPGGGKAPALSYSRNRAYSWQRISSWILLIGIILHVIQMRFVDYPVSVHEGLNKNYFMIRLDMDKGLYTVANRLDVQLFDKSTILKAKSELESSQSKPFSSSISPLEHFNPVYQEGMASELIRKQQTALKAEFIKGLEKKTLQSNQVIAVSKEFGSAVLLTVRDTFKNPLMIALYSILVITACYHGFNGLWSFCITWGITLTKRSQKIMLGISWALMIIMSLLGLVAIWGTYWFNLKS